MRVERHFVKSCNPLKCIFVPSAMPSCVRGLLVLFRRRKGEISNAEFISIYMALFAITSTQYSQHRLSFVRGSQWIESDVERDIYYFDPCG